MEWLKPIDEVEAEFRKRGAFLLADARNRKLWFFHYSKDTAGIKQMMETMKGRSTEMVEFLIARASVRVRPK